MLDCKLTETAKRYWKLVHPQWAILDPALHTFDFVRSRSAMLMTTLLALGSTALATLPQRVDEDVAEALSLHAHIEKLNLIVYTTGARSLEIIQAHIVNPTTSPLVLVH